MVISGHAHLYLWPIRGVWLHLSVLHFVHKKSVCHADFNMKDLLFLSTLIDDIMCQNRPTATWLDILCDIYVYIYLGILQWANGDTSFVVKIKRCSKCARWFSIPLFSTKWLMISPASFKSQSKESQHYSLALKTCDLNWYISANDKHPVNMTCQICTILFTV